MSRQLQPRYVEKFTLAYNRGPVRVTQELEVTIDLATIRRIVGLHACLSKGKQAKEGCVTVRVISESSLVSDATSHRKEVAVD